MEEKVSQLKTRWESLPLTARLGLGAVAATLVAAVVAIVAVSGKPSMSTLYSGLSESDAGAVSERLSQLSVPYDFGEDRTTIVVPDDRVHEMRLLLAGEGLPSSAGVGFEVFDQQRFGESEFAEQIKYRRALEGELARTISHLSGVRRARVHLVLPERSLFNDKEAKASASVALQLKPGHRMDEEQARGIIHMVSSSVRGLQPDRITLVDGKGSRIAGGTEEQSDAPSDMMRFTREVESKKEAAAQEILSRTLGPGRSIVRVAARVDYTREERTEEVFDPEGTAARSFQVTEERSGGPGNTVGGIPGTPSNLPGGEAPTAGITGDKGLNTRSETRNFEVSKVLKRVVEPVGRVTGMTVAVVVDGKWKQPEAPAAGEEGKDGDKDEKAKKGEEGKEGEEGEEGENAAPVAAPVFEPLPREELDRIRDIVASAVGIDPSRGDSVTVECVPFAPIEVDEAELSLIEKWLGPYAKYLPKVLGGIFILLLVAILARRGKEVITSLAAPALPPPAEEDEDGDGEGGDVTELTVREAGDKASGPSEEEIMNRVKALGGQAPAVGPGAETAKSRKPSKAKLDAAQMDEIRAIAAELAAEDPEAAARILRGWLQEAKAAA